MSPQAQRVVIDRAQRTRIRDYHRALDDATNEAELIAELVPPERLTHAAQRLHEAAERITQALTNGNTTAAHSDAIEAAGEALGIAATLATTKRRG